MDEGINKEFVVDDGLLEWFENSIPSKWQRWWRETDWLHPSRTLRKIQNILRWVPILWDDVDWDYTSLYAVIEAKLEFMAEHHLEHDNHEGTDELIAQMVEARYALVRARADDYLQEEFAAYHAKYPWKPMREWETTAEGHRIMPPMIEEQAAEFRALCVKEDQMRDADLKEFARIFVEHSRGWWD